MGGQWFPNIFHEKSKKAWHVTTATHNSRYSQRMFDNHIVVGEPVWLDQEDEIIITEVIKDIVIADKLTVLEYNICGDHMHILLVCDEVELPKIIGKLKSVSAKIRNRKRGYTTGREAARGVSDVSATRGHAPLSVEDTPEVGGISVVDTTLSPAATDASSSEEPKEDRTTKRGKTQLPVWTQKFGRSEIKDEKYLANAIAYIRNNRTKHGLPEIKEIENLKKEFLCSYP